MKRKVVIALIGIVLCTQLLCGCGKKTQEEKMQEYSSKLQEADSIEEADEIIDEMLELVDGEVVEEESFEQPIIDFSSFECDDLVKRSKLADGYMQIADVVIKVDGTMSIGEVVDELKESSLDFELDNPDALNYNSEFGFNDIRVYLAGKKIDIVGINIDQDRETVAKKDLVCINLEPILDAEEIPIYIGGGININSKELHESDIQTLIENEGLAEENLGYGANVPYLPEGGWEKKDTRYDIIGPMIYISDVYENSAYVLQDAMYYFLRADIQVADGSVSNLSYSSGKVTKKLELK